MEVRPKGQRTLVKKDSHRDPSSASTYVRSGSHHPSLKGDFGHGSHPSSRHHDNYDSHHSRRQGHRSRSPRQHYDYSDYRDYRGRYDSRRSRSRSIYSRSHSRESQSPVSDSVPEFKINQTDLERLRSLAQKGIDALTELSKFFTEIGKNE